MCAQTRYLNEKLDAIIIADLSYRYVGHAQKHEVVHNTDVYTVMNKMIWAVKHFLTFIQYLWTIYPSVQSLRVSQSLRLNIMHPNWNVAGNPQFFLNAWLMRMLSDCLTLQIAAAGVPSVTLRFQRLGNPLSIQCYLLVSDPSDLKSFCFLNSLFKNYCKMLKISNMVFDSEFIY